MADIGTTDGSLHSDWRCHGWFMAHASSIEKGEPNQVGTVLQRAGRSLAVGVIVMELVTDCPGCNIDCLSTVDHVHVSRQELAPILTSQYREYDLVIQYIDALPY